ncbi:hypothetical protein SteCoe_14481 [Stentor coeruleus]|uniref:Uncharacterized protein n=1 Tax=Stentor coeruleus TaxID=5963 RepID=A0A1R2C5Y9_9CILI|nr:hypothetical protein SteCoe_14481 [Stentor coeruleus]
MNSSDYSPDSTGLTLEATLISLEDEKNRLSSQEKYVEANQISKKIQDLKSQIHKQKLTQLKITHKEEKQLVEKSFSDELCSFEINWDSIISAFSEKCLKELNRSMIKHEKKMRILKEKLENEIMKNFIPSPCLLNMIKCKEQAVKQDKFVEAQGLFLQIEQLRNEEVFRYNENKKMTIEQHLANYNEKYEKKLQALKKRQRTRLDELNIQKQEEYKRIERKYENLKRDLENGQNIKINLHEGKHTTSAGRHSSSPLKSNDCTLSTFRQQSLVSKQE